MSPTQRTLTLRELAREYAGGRIDRQTYRQRRTRLLNELVAGAPTVPSQQRPSPDPDLPISAARHRPGVLGIGLTLLLALLLAGALWVWFAYRDHPAILEPVDSTQEIKSTGKLR